MTKARIGLDNIHWFICLRFWFYQFKFTVNSKNDTRNADDTEQNHALTGMVVVNVPWNNRLEDICNSCNEKGNLSTH